MVVFTTGLAALEAPADFPAFAFLAAFCSPAYLCLFDIFAFLGIRESPFVFFVVARQNLFYLLFRIHAILLFGVLGLTQGPGLATPSAVEQPFLIAGRRPDLLEEYLDVHRDFVESGVFDADVLKGREALLRAEFGQFESLPPAREAVDSDDPLEIPVEGTGDDEDAPLAPPGEDAGDESEGGSDGRSEGGE